MSIVKSAIQINFTWLILLGEKIAHSTSTLYLNDLSIFSTCLSLMRGVTPFNTNPGLWNTFLWPCFQLARAPEMVAMVSWSHMFWWCRSSSCWNDLQIHVHRWMIPQESISLHTQACMWVFKTHHASYINKYILYQAKNEWSSKGAVVL